MSILTGTPFQGTSVATNLLREQIYKVVLIFHLPPTPRPHFKLKRVPCIMGQAAQRQQCIVETRQSWLTPTVKRQLSCNIPAVAIW